MPAMGAIIGAAGSLIGGNQAAGAAQDAANAGAQGSRDAIGAFTAFNNLNRQDHYGQMVTGNSALNRIAQMYGLDYYDGLPSWDGVQVSGGETTTDRPSAMQRMLDPGGLIWQQESSTSPMQFSVGGGAPGAGGTGNSLGGAASNMPGQVRTGTGTADFSSFWQTPDYLARYDEGLRALDRNAARRGSLYSGGTDADRIQFGAQQGAQGFGSYLDTLFRTAGYGSNAAGQVGSSGQTFGSNIGSALQDAGRSRASGYLGAGAAWGNAWNGVGSAFGDYWGQQQQNRNNPWGGG